MASSVLPIPYEYLCPITQDIMKNPVILIEDVSKILALLHTLKFSAKCFYYIKFSVPHSIGKVDFDSS